MVENNDNLYIVLLNTAISSEYFLLYKNFKKRNLALNYCNKYVYFLDKCLIVNVQNFNK